MSNSIFDPTNTTFRDLKSSQNGRLYCICAAVSEKAQQDTYELLPSSVWIFCPNTSHGHKDDYHRNFDSVNSTG